MKIAFITNVFPVLYNTFTVNEIEQLMQRGHQVTVFSLYRWYRPVNYEKSIKMADAVEYFEDILARDRGAVMKMLVEHSGKIQRFSPRVYESIGRYLFSGSVDTAIARKYHGQLGWNVYALADLTRVIQSERFNVIHAGYGNRPAEAAMALSRMTGVPFSFEAHAYDLFVDFPFADEKIHEAAKIFTISNYNKDYLVGKLGSSPEKVVVMRVPIDKANCDRIPEQARENNLLIAVCRLHPIKGLDHALEALKLVAEKRKSVRLILVGDGPQRAHLERMTQKLSLQNNVIFCGNKGNDEALALVAKATAFVLPSIIAANGDRDGIPTSLIEAMYLRTPVISTRVSGIPELIDDGMDGLLAEPGDVKGLARKIEQVLGDSALRERLGRAAREKVEHGFYIQDTAEVLLDGWKDIITHAT